MQRIHTRARAYMHGAACTVPRRVRVRVMYYGYVCILYSAHPYASKPCRNEASIRACVRGVAILLEIAVKKRHGGGNSFDGRKIGIRSRSSIPAMRDVGPLCIREIRQFDKRIIRRGNREQGSSANESVRFRPTVVFTIDSRDNEVCRAFM